MKIGWKSYSATIAAAVALAFGLTKKDEPAQDSLKITQLISVEVIGSDGVPLEKFIQIEEQIPHTNHLNETLLITKSIHGCLKNQTRPNGKEFFTAAERFLRAKQVDVMRNPAEIENVKSEMKNALRWFAQNQDKSKQDFARAFYNSGLKITEYAPAITL